MCGQLGWAYFIRCMGSSSGVLTGNKGLFEKVYFPRLAVPLASVINTLFGVGIQFLSFAGFWCYFKFATPAGEWFGLTAAVLLVPFCLVQSAALGLGVGLWLSALSAKYRDVARLGSMIPSLWMYATPVVWPLSLFLDRVPARWQWLPGLNPMTFTVECFRVAFLGKGTLLPGFALSSLALSALVFVSGVMIFNKTERTFVDTA
jgi:lipopolysaccharide transport system permease protein